MQYRYVFFDMDGTLLDTLDDLRDSVNTILSNYGLAPITHYEAAHFLGNGAKHLVHCSLKQQVSPEQEEKILEEYKVWYQDHCRIKTSPYPGVMDLLAHLKAVGCRMAVVSNKPDPAVRELNEYFFGDLIETAIGEKTGIRRKPAPDTLLEAMRLLEADRKECVYVGDTEVDLQTAENAGLNCICVAWGFRSVEELQAAGADTIINNADGLEKLITGGSS